MGKKRDILFLCQFFYPEYISSAQLPYDTVRALQAEGFTVDVLCGYPKEYSDGTHIPVKEDREGIHIHRLKYIQMDRSGFLGRLINYFSFTFMVFLQLWRTANYRAVVVYSNPPILPWIVSWAKVLFGTKFVFVAYDLYPEVLTVTNTFGPGNPICRLMDHINKCVFRRVDKVVALSTEMKDYIESSRPASRGKVEVIPNWYPDSGEPDKDRTENAFLEVVGDRFTVAYFGNMGTMQDLATILDAIRALREERVFFLFAGHGTKMEKLKQTIQEENLPNVAVYDFLKGKDFADALAISDCALISLEKGVTGLGCPSKTYSYMMQGIPLLAIMDESDIVRDIESGAGFWCRNGESEVLASAIRRLMADPRLVERMGCRCREIYLQNYTAPICTGKYVALMRDVLNQYGKKDKK